MAGELKSFFSPALVRRLADEVSRAHRSFPRAAFEKAAARGLERLELLDRARHIARALATHLPDDYERGVRVLLRSLGPPHERDELIGAGMAPFFYMPHLIYVAERGIDHFDLSMEAQYELTKRFTAELSIRPFIAKDPQRAFRWLAKWSRDPNAHVRRLVSEGTRLRLPWAPRVAWLDANPDRVVALLERLKDDPASVVRRSVANNLNDLGKVHRALAMRTCGAWLRGASAERRALVEHALRSAVKRGEPEALRLLGYGKKPSVVVEEVRLDPKKVRIGEKVALTFVLRSTSNEEQSLLVDAAVHFVKARGHASRKVFKLERVELPARGTKELGAKISLAVHTTRKPFPGEHDVDVIVNGVTMRAGSFGVVPARS